jgi:hypothetical protein
MKKMGQMNQGKPLCPNSRMVNGEHEWVTLLNNADRPQMDSCVRCGMIRVSKTMSNFASSMYSTGWRYFGPFAESST